MRHALPGLAPGQGVDARQGASSHGQEVAQQGVGRGAHVEPGDGHDAAERYAQARQDLPAVLDAAEQLEDGDPGGLQADEGGGGGDGGQLQGGDEAGEMQGQGEGCHERPAELPAR